MPILRPQIKLLYYIYNSEEKNLRLFKKGGDKMKIIFDNEKEKEKIVNEMAKSELCPNQIGLLDDCGKDCYDCWKEALEKIEGRKSEI